MLTGVEQQYLLPHASSSLFCSEAQANLHYILALLHSDSDSGLGGYLGLYF